MESVSINNSVMMIAVVMRNCKMESKKKLMKLRLLEKSSNIESMEPNLIMRMEFKVETLLLLNNQRR